MHLLLQWLILSLAFWLTARLVPGFHVRSLGDAIVVAAVFGIVNFLLGTLLYYVLGIATLGIGFFMVTWTERKQGLHDKIAHTLVIKTSTSQMESGIRRDQ